MGLTDAAFCAAGALGAHHKPFQRTTTFMSPLRVPVARRIPAGLPARSTPCAKIFAWKERNDPTHGDVGGDGVYRLNNLRPAPGSRHRKKRKGRGHAAGQGGSCGFGMRGQKSRSGRGVRPGFEGGQTPLYRRVPKFVGRPTGPGHKKTEYALIKLAHLNMCKDGAVVTMGALQGVGVCTKQKRKLFKVVGGEELKAANLTVRAHAFTSSAVEAIEGAGGKCVLLSPTTGKALSADGEVVEEIEEVFDPDILREGALENPAAADLAIAEESGLESGSESGSESESG